jgi:hypothetical protein
MLAWPPHPQQKASLWHWPSVFLISLIGALYETDKLYESTASNIEEEVK